MSGPHPRVLGLLAGLAAAACQGRDFGLSAQASMGTGVRVKEIQLGREIDLEKRVTDPTERFRPGDVVFVTIVTEDAASVLVLKARWTQQDRVLSETTQRIAPHREAVSEFHVWKADGWVAGEYEVQILADEVPVGSRRFSVE